MPVSRRVRSRLASRASVTVKASQKSRKITAMWERIAERLEGRIIVLERIERRHADDLRAAAADERIWRFMVTIDVERWLAHAIAEQSRARESSSPCFAMMPSSARRAT